jgi:ABC-type ATPase with predicted acetyltransferase domain
VLSFGILGLQIRPCLTFSHQVYKPASDMVAHDAVPVLREMQAVIPGLIATFFVGHAVVGHQCVQVEGVAAMFRVLGHGFLNDQVTYKRSPLRSLMSVLSLSRRSSRLLLITAHSGTVRARMLAP